MTQTATAKKLKQTETVSLSTIEGGKSTNKAVLEISFPDTKMALLCVILAMLQIMDGILTAIGVSTFGSIAEGNALLRGFMEQFGALYTLVFAKGLAIGIIAFLALCGKNVKWLPSAIAVLILFYALAAIAPWTYTLSRVYLM